MSRSRKLAAILVSDVAGYSRREADEDRTLARLRSLRSDLIDPIISVHRGRVVKRTGDGSIIEFRSVVDAVRCAIEVQAGWSAQPGHSSSRKGASSSASGFVGDVVQSDGDLMGDRGQHRRAVGRDRQAGRDLSFKGLSAGQGRLGAR